MHWRLFNDCILILVLSIVIHMSSERPGRRRQHDGGDDADKTSRRPTMRMCRYIHEIDPPCRGPCRWCLVGDAGEFVVCDAHLADAIRSCDLPARIDRPGTGDDVLSVRFVSKRNPLPKP